MRGGEVERDEAAERGADEQRALDRGSIEHADDVGGVTERAQGRARAAKAAEIEARQGEPRLPRGPLRVPHPAVCATGVDQDDCRAGSRVFDVERADIVTASGVPALVLRHVRLLRDGWDPSRDAAQPLLRPAGKRVTENGLVIRTSPPSGRARVARAGG